MPPKIRKFIEAWGVTVEEVDFQREWRTGIHRSAIPSLAIHWPEPILLVNPDYHMGWSVPRRLLWLLHELSHIVIGECPQGVDEFGSGMWAFEVMATRHLKIPKRIKWEQTSAAVCVQRFKNYQKHYPQRSPQDFVEFVDLKPRHRRQLFQISLAAAKKHGLLHEDNTLTYKRRILCNEKTSLVPPSL